MSKREETPEEAQARALAAAEALTTLPPGSDIDKTATDTCLDRWMKWLRSVEGDENSLPRRRPRKPKDDGVEGSQGETLSHLRACLEGYVGALLQTTVNRGGFSLGVMLLPSADLNLALHQVGIPQRFTHFVTAEHFTSTLTHICHVFKYRGNLKLKSLDTRGQVSSKQKGACGALLTWAGSTRQSYYPPLKVEFGSVRHAAFIKRVSVTHGGMIWAAKR